MQVILTLALVNFIFGQINDNQTNQTLVQQTSNADSIHTALLHGGVDLGYYYVNIYIGTPPKKQTVIVDTGSSTTTFPCNDCKDCGKHIDAKFDYEKSTTAQVLQCHEKVDGKECSQCDDKSRCSFSISFAEQSSLRGYFIRDYILFGDVLYDLYQETQQYIFHEYQRFLVGDNLKKQDADIINREHFKTVFGCTTLETNLFKTQKADGIMGLSPRTNYGNNLPNVVDDLFQKYKLQGQHLSFSLCYNNDVGGYMSIGGYDKHRHQPKAITYTIPYYNDGGLFKIKIRDVKIGSISLDLDPSQYDLGHGSFVDSGTTLVYAHSSIYDAMTSKYQQYCDANNNQCPNLQKLGGQFCFKYNSNIHSLEEFFQKFPTVYFELENGFSFDWVASDYLYLDTYVTSQSNMYCFPLQSYPGHKFSNKLDRFILGGVWMRSWDILFDRQNESLQFTRSKCSNTKIHTKPRHSNEHEQVTDLKGTSMESPEKIQNTSATELDDKYPTPDDESNLTYLIYAFLTMICFGALVCSFYLVKKFLYRRGSHQMVSQSNDQANNDFQNDTEQQKQNVFEYEPLNNEHRVSSILPDNERVGFVEEL